MPIRIPIRRVGASSDKIAQLRKQRSLSSTVPANNSDMSPAMCQRVQSYLQGLPKPDLASGTKYKEALPSQTAEEAKKPWAYMRARRLKPVDSFRYFAVNNLTAIDEYDFYPGAIFVVDKDRKFASMPQIIPFQDGDRKRITCTGRFAGQTLKGICTDETTMREAIDSYVSQYKQSGMNIPTKVTMTTNLSSSTSGISIGGSIKGVDFGFGSGTKNKTSKIIEIRQELYSISLNNNITSVKDLFTGNFDETDFQNMVRTVGNNGPLAIMDTVSFGRVVYIVIEKESNTPPNLDVSYTPVAPNPQEKQKTEADAKKADQKDDAQKKETEENGKKGESTKTDVKDAVADAAKDAVSDAAQKLGSAGKFSLSLKSFNEKEKCKVRIYVRGGNFSGVSLGEELVKEGDIKEVLSRLSCISSVNDLETAVPIGFTAKYIDNMQPVEGHDYEWYNERVDEVLVKVRENNKGASMSTKVRFLEYKYLDNGTCGYKFNNNCSGGLDQSFKTSPKSVCFDIKIDVVGGEWPDFNFTIPYIPYQDIVANEDGDYVFDIRIGGNAMGEARDNIYITPSLRGCATCRGNKYYMNDDSSDSPFQMSNLHLRTEREVLLQYCRWVDLRVNNGKISYLTGRNPQLSEGKRE